MYHIYLNGSLCTSIIAFKLCLFSDCTTLGPQLPNVVSVTSVVKDSCGLPPLMFCIPISACQGTCAKELGHICMFSQSVLQLHRIDSISVAYIQNWDQKEEHLVRNSPLCVWESSWCIFALLQVSPVQAADEHDNHRKGQETISFHNILFIFITCCVSSVSHLAFWFCAYTQLFRLFLSAAFLNEVDFLSVL